jgi:hypothetical protein
VEVPDTSPCWDVKLVVTPEFATVNVLESGVDAIVTLLKLKVASVKFAMVTICPAMRPCAPEVV